jgi:hypothetical protein
MYETSGENSLLVGITDVTIQGSQTSNNPEANVALLSPPAQPMTVTLPMP